MLAIIIMINNYLHDVATALLLSSAFVVWILNSTLSPETNPEVISYFVRVYGKITRLAKIALVWILLGGIPRTLAYKQFEWSDAAGRGQIPALIVKHIFLFMAVGLGIYFWVQLNKKVRALEKF